MIGAAVIIVIVLPAAAVEFAHGRFKPAQYNSSSFTAV
jgi:hypothetical protein